MATVQIPRRVQQLELYPGAVEPFVPHFEQVETQWNWERIGALAFLSLMVHVFFALVIVAMIFAMPKNSPIVLTARDLLGQSQSVYLPLAPDTQKLTEKPKTNIISDKDRSKMSRTPTIDRKTLEQLADNLRPGAPATPSSAGSQPQAPSPAAQPQSPRMEPQAGGTPPQPANQIAQLHSPAFSGASGAPDFGGPATAGSAIQQAARAAAEQRGGGRSVGGDYGLGSGNARTTQRGDLEILSDTLGVDFAPYLARMRLQIMNNWMALIPEAARPPLRKKGMVMIEFSITKDGTIAGLRLVGPSGDVSLDRAAYGSITASNPMAPLPTDFRGDYLTIRARFYYNPDRGDMPQIQ